MSDRTNKWRVWRPSLSSGNVKYISLEQVLSGHGPGRLQPGADLAEDRHCQLGMQLQGHTLFQILSVSFADPFNFDTAPVWIRISFVGKRIPIRPKLEKKFQLFVVFKTFFLLISQNIIVVII